MTQSGSDNMILIELYPGKYLMKFDVDGVECLNPGVDIELDPNGLMVANILNPDPQSHELYGHTSAALLHDFMALPGNEVSAVVKFSAGSKCGSIPPEAKACPCSEVGYMLLNGFFHCVKHEYLRGYSWAGCFKPIDMVVVDGKHCQIRRRANYRLTRAHLILDVSQLKKYLLSKYEQDKVLPPYFSNLITVLEDPPADFDSNEASKDQFLDLFVNQAALATPPRRMLFLVNLAQFYKHLPTHLLSGYAQIFNTILQDKNSWSWQGTTLNDKLLKAVFVAKRRVDASGNLVSPVTNSGLEANYSLRVFFVHGPEHTLVGEVQELKAFAEIDLIISYHFENLVADSINRVYDYQHSHVLIKAIWDFYCGGSPPKHIQM